jgi:DNA polymerase-3 subunit epsilon
LKKDLSCANPNNPFYNKKVVITGVFDVERENLATKLKSLGADLDTAISKRTNFVFIGREAGPSKLAKLQSLIENGYNIRQLGQQEVTQIMLDNLNTI